MSALPTWLLWPLLTVIVVGGACLFFWSTCVLFDIWHRIRQGRQKRHGGD